MRSERQLKNYILSERENEVSRNIIIRPVGLVYPAVRAKYKYERTQQKINIAFNIN